MEKLLSLREVAEVMGLDTPHYAITLLRKWGIKPIRIGKKTIRVREIDLNRFLKAHEEQTYRKNKEERR